MLSKFKFFVKKYQKEILIFIIIVLISLFSFAIGFIVSKEQSKMPIQFEENF
ncbi:MAG: hypothetical protein PHO28_01025 [Candidatus Pacebacteria bacterium]|nr:hypothetical protein [Candidatus Paceibacterota bacterium]